MRKATKEERRTLPPRQQLVPQEEVRYGKGFVVDTSPYVEFGETYLRFDKDTPFQVWQVVTQQLLRAEKCIRWWIGDAIRFGERKYGEMYSQALQDATGYSYGTLRNSVYVADKYPELSLRNDNCTFRQHEIAAALEPDERAEVLGRAYREAWTERQLREEVRERRALPAANDPDDDRIPDHADSMAICPSCSGNGVLPSRKAKKIANLLSSTRKG